MEHNEAPGLNGFPIELYLKFLHVFKDDLMGLFDQLHADQLDMFRLA